MVAILRLGWLLSLAMCATGCGRKESAAGRPAAAPEAATSVAAAPSPDANGPHARPQRKVVLQTDWFPQAEHGGFYHALVHGFYREAGLEVDILPGGPGAGIRLKLARGDADFCMSKSDDAIVSASGGLPFVLVMATMQHDAQAVMVHADSPVKSLRDLDGRVVIASPSMTWIPYVKRRYGIAFDLKPNTYGLGEFLARPDTIQQCLVTNEPFFARQRGQPVRTLSLAESGWDCYPAVICRRDLLRSAPEVVRAFVAASIRGWRGYMEDDPAAAHEMILKRNPQMTPGLLAFSREAMLAQRLVHGDPARGEAIGRIAPERIAAQIRTLVELKVIEQPVPLESVLATEFPPAK